LTSGAARLTSDHAFRHRCEFHAADDEAAIKHANDLYEGFGGPGVTLDRYVLYEGDRVVHEHVGSKR
jgi:hypothetical protein